MTELCRQLVERATCAQREHRFADARRDWTTVVEQLRQENAEDTLARALRALGEVERKMHDVDAARRHYEEAVILSRRWSDPLTFAHTVRHLGDVCYEAGQPQLADACYREALEVYRSHPEAAAPDVANAIRSMAVLKGELAEVEEARHLWSEAKELYAAAGVSKGVAESVKQLARLDRKTSI
jgi:tetratricopeptide (TPR) repeat protein